MANALDLAPIESASPRASALTMDDYGHRPLTSRGSRLFSRMRDILAANLNDMLEHADSPEKMIRMIICEMEETLVHARAATARSIADQKELKLSVATLRQAAEEWQERAAFALTRDRDDLARQALIEKAKSEKRLGELEEEIAELDRSLDSHYDDIARLQKKLAEACARRDRIRARLDAAENSIRLRELLNGGALQDAMSRFEELERQVDDAEGHAEAAAIGMEDDRPENDPVLNAKIDAELAAMRATTRDRRSADAANRGENDA